MMISVPGPMSRMTALFLKASGLNCGRVTWKTGVGLMMAGILPMKRHLPWEELGGRIAEPVKCNEMVLRSTAELIPG